MSTYAKPTHMIFGTVKDFVNVFDRTKNKEICRIFVGGDILILIFTLWPQGVVETEESWTLNICLEN